LGGLGAVAGAVPGQQILDPPGRMVWQTGEHIGEPCPRVDIVQLGGVYIDGGAL